MSGSGWCTTESDPAVFTELIERFGVKGVAVEEVLSIDEASLAALPQPVFGLILLFKWKPSKGDRNVIADAEVYFAKQTVRDACATQAIVNILLNCADRLDLGGELSSFLEFTGGLDPRMRGDMIGQSELLRAAHNSFSRPNVFSFEEKHAKEDADTFHFIAYTVKDGVVWELDGLQDGPIFIEPASDTEWLKTAADAVNSRIQEIAQQDTTGAGQGISFSLLAVTRDKVEVLREQVAAAKARGSSAADLEEDLRAAQEEREAGKAENARRRHNYIPAIVALLRALKDKGELGALIEATKETQSDAIARKKNRAERA
jgi:ubiquitin carboxyl-terminal hydrolase L5